MLFPVGEGIYKQMSISKYPSKLSLPQTNPGITTVLDYLIIKFPDINPKVWQQRMLDGNVHWHDGSLINPDSSFQAQQRVYYYREVENESLIPFEEEIIFHDENILVAHKPNFLAVTPGGKYIKECLQNRLRNKTGIENLQALHRLDRVTAGLVLFSINPETRHLYHQLFETRKILKTYQAIAKVNIKENLMGKKWVVQNRIIKSTPSFIMKIIDGEANSHSEIHCQQQSNDKALFELKPITGKTHQLRLHMESLGHPILNDKYYPTLEPETADDFSKPLQLLAKELQFIDPVTQKTRIFDCNKNLKLDTI